MKLTKLAPVFVVLLTARPVSAQTSTTALTYERVPLNEAAVAHDANGASAL